MKNRRQETILELIENNIVDTQELLQEMLAQRGFSVTQATVSRDIRELNLVKSTGIDGVYKYRTHSAPKDDRQVISDTYLPILRHAVIGAEAAGNLVVVKTRNGMGNAVGAALDAIDIPQCVGTLAGDDTLLMIAKTNEAAERICGELKRTVLLEND
jgi:transcriptional regulator of arginine metabolism